MKFDSIEEKVIYEKLTKDSLATEYKDKNSSMELSSAHCGGSDPHECIADLHKLISILDDKRVNVAYRPIFSKGGLRGKMGLFIKKVLRKLIKWYVEPICVQQTDFNNAVTPSIGKLTEIQEVILEKLSIFDNFKKELSEKMMEVEELQKIANLKIIESDEKLKLIEETGMVNISHQEFNLWDKKTYSQSGEDSIIAYILTVLGIPLKKCTYLDLGANHAKDMSNTYYLYSQGAAGVLVEANPQLMKELKFYRHRDVILNKCVAESSKELVDFHILSGDGLSTSFMESASQCINENPDLKIIETVQIETICPNDILEKYFDNSPTILNIDIEGNDLEVLNSINFDRYRPLIVITEMIEYKTHLVVGKKNKMIFEYMESKNYVEYAFTGINSVFLDKIQLERYIKQ